MPRGVILSRGLRFIRRQIDDLLDVVFPPVCGLCGQPADSGDRLICRRCWNLVQGLEAPYCSKCKKLLLDQSKCPDCRPAPLTIFTLGYYEGHLQTILHDLKYQGLKPLAERIGQKLGEKIAVRIEDFGIDFILPVPLHDSRLYYRGFNQSEEIARAIGEILDLPVKSDILYAARKTKQQAKLPAYRREANVRGAFGVDDQDSHIPGKTILLVDDVTTTGATLRENSRVLYAAGAGKIVAAVAAAAL